MAKKSRKPDFGPKMRTPPHPLAEVFGFPFDNHSDLATRHRGKRLCPFNNKVPNCTKDKANDPLGTCTIFDGDDLVITCPIRFRQNWIIADDAADFFFPKNARWTSLTEVRLKDKDGGSAGNIDIVLVSYDDRGRVLDFGALEVQAVYTSFDAALSTITKSEPGDVNDFVAILQDKLDEKLEENNPPDTSTLDQIVGGQE